MVYSLFVNSGDLYGYNVGSEMLDGDRDKVRPIDETPDGGTAPGNGPLSFGRHVATEHLPTRMRWKETEGRPMPDFHESGILNVSERAKALIEKFEPGVHQFVPVEFVDNDYRFLENRYFMFPGNRIDSTDHDGTTYVLIQYPKEKSWVNPHMLLRKGKANLIPPGFDFALEPKYVFSQSKIHGCHIWVDKHIDGAILISDELAQEIREEGLTGLKLANAPLETTLITR